MPTFDGDLVRGGYLHFDAQADDARLTLLLARTATLDFGAVAANHVAVVELLTDPAGRVGGAVVEEVEGCRMEVTANAVVNAAGIWTDEVLGLDGVTASRTIRSARGVHVPSRGRSCATRSP
jgi:glycerol-3-phosphate dehydrogenase